MLYLAVIIGGILLDQLIKWLIVANLPLGSGFALVPGLLGIHYVQNTGAAWSIFSGNTMGLAVFSVFMAALLGVWIWKTPSENRCQRLALSLMLAGAFGNMLDRFRLGYVIDFIELPHWPIFNIADMLLCIGVAWLAVLLIRQEIAERRNGE